MPRLPDATTDCAFYLYPDRPSAEEGGQIGGTGFLVAKQFSHPLIAEEGVLFAISNRHVVEQHGASVMRLTLKDGSADIIELMPEDWTVHPTADLAAVCGYVDPVRHRCRWIMHENIVTKDSASNFDIGIGDDVYMVGRFIGHDGRATNRPSVRFGSVSVPVAPIFNPALGRDEESYGVEMRSMSGYSGSPVLVFGTPPLVPPATPMRREAERFVLLLGVNWGQITVPRRVLDEAGHPSSGQYVAEGSGMNGVVPGWHVTSLLEQPQLKAKYRELERSRLLERRYSKPMPA